ncbi:MAG: carboxypeptidase regulatory-like domain-containing protein [Acidimicrobiales bacterium]|jgi:hypothetical protein
MSLRRRCYTLGGVLAVLLFLLAPLSVQAASASTLTGTVTAAGLPVVGAFVAATGPNGQAVAVSDSNGDFDLTIPDGTYTIASNEPGYLASVTPGVTVSGSSTENVDLTPSGATLAPVPVYGGGDQVAADGTPGVFYIAGDNTGNLYRSIDYGGTWTAVTLATDDPTNGLSEASSPDLLTTSGYPGEVAVLDDAVGVAQPSGIFYSTDYGVTWQLVGDSPQNGMHGNGMQLLWGHAGSTSVLMAIQDSPFEIYVADMTVADPTFIQMTTPYPVLINSSDGSDSAVVAVADGVDQPWLATANTLGVVSVYPLVAQATAPAAETTVSGFTTSPATVGIGGESATGEPPSGLIVQDASTGDVQMSLWTAGTGYPAPVSPAANSCFAPGMGSPYRAQFTPNTDSSYGAVWINNCWVQDVAGSLTTQTGYGSSVAIDADYDATNVSSGSDAVLMITGYSRGVEKLAGTDQGFPISLSDQTTVAGPGTAADSSGVATTGITGDTVFQTAFGPEGADQVASATGVGGVASDDNGANFEQATYDGAWSVAWWQGATHTWLLYGLIGGSGTTETLVDAVPDWTSSTTAIGTGDGNGNVSGSTAEDLGLAAPITSPVVDSLAGVPGQDAVFIDTASANPMTSDRTGAVSFATITTAPAFSNVTPIGSGVITAPGPIAYCPSTGSATSLQNVLLVVADNSSGGGVYRVTDPTSASPRVAKTVSLSAPGMQALASLAVDCGSGTVLAASGNPADGLLKSTDGGQTFSPVALPSSPWGIRALAIASGDPSSMLVGDSSGEILSSADGGQTWTEVNDPSNGGVNLSSGANFSGGMFSLVEPPAASSGPGEARPAVSLRPSTPATTPDFVAGPGEYAGKLATQPPPTPKLADVSLRNAKFLAKKGTTLRLTLSEAAKVTIVVNEPMSGRKVKGECKLGAQTGERCVLMVRKAKIAFYGVKGKNDFKFLLKELSPGRYFATLTAEKGTGPTSKPDTIAFTILRPRS